METYHKIQTVFHRDLDNRCKTLLEGQYSLPEFEYLAQNQWIFTEKVDGTNIRVIFKDGEVTFRGKTDTARLTPQLEQRLPNLFKGKENFFGDKEACLYGEGYGPGIRKWGKYTDFQDFVLFDVWIDGWWLRRPDVEDVAKTLGIEIVPIIGTGTLPEMVEMTRKGFKSQWGDFIAEGIIARPEVELMSRGDNRVITKIKYKDFNKVG